MGVDMDVECRWVLSGWGSICMDRDWKWVGWTPAMPHLPLVIGAVHQPLRLAVLDAYAADDQHADPCEDRSEQWLQWIHGDGGGDSSSKIAGKGRKKEPYHTIVGSADRRLLVCAVVGYDDTSAHGSPPLCRATTHPPPSSSTSLATVRAARPITSTHVAADSKHSNQQNAA